MFILYNKILHWHLGGVSVLKFKGIGANNHYFIGGVLNSILIFFSHAIIM